MQSDLQSVGKFAFNTFARAFAPKAYQIGLSYLSRIYRYLPNAALPASPGAQLQKVTVNTFFIQLGQIRLRSPIESKKTVFFDPIHDNWAAGEAGGWSGQNLDKSWAHSEARNNNSVMPRGEKPQFRAPFSGQTVACERPFQRLCSLTEKDCLRDYRRNWPITHALALSY